MEIHIPNIKTLDALNSKNKRAGLEDLKKRDPEAFEKFCNAVQSNVAFKIKLNESQEKTWTD